jgi:ubiquinone/menaquinone biosynthesis C-methylase UbiE
MRNDLAYSASNAVTSASVLSMKVVAMATVDPFARTDELDDRTLAALIARFEARGRHPTFMRMLQEYLDAMHVDDATQVVDLGCGTGIAARAIARRGGFGGTVTGVDLSPYLVAAAQRLAGEEGVAGTVVFLTGDTRDLDAADGVFDAAVAHTLLSHVDDPMAALSEAARVLSVGGVLGVFDGDYAALTFGHRDPLKARTYDEALVNSIVASPRVMRQMPRLLHAAGFELIASFAHVLADVGTADFWSSAIDTYARLMPKAGMVTQADADAWAEALHNDSAEGLFFASCTYYAYVARRA